MVAQYMYYLQSVDTLKTYLLSFGQWTPAIFFIIQILQVVIAPIPGGTTTLIGGALFGGFWGFILSGVAVMIGSCAAFLLTKKLGRPFVLKFASKGWVEKFESIDEAKINVILFLIFLFPSFPDDMLCFVSGLTKIRFKTFFILCLVGRMPGLLLTALSGAGLVEDNPTQLIIVLAIYALFAGVLFFNKKKLDAFIDKNKKPVKENNNDDQ